MIFLRCFSDGLPSLNALKVTTATKPLFCSTECLDHVGCQSIVFDASKSEDNCMLSSEANGASSNEATVTYVKESSVEKVNSELFKMQEIGVSEIQVSNIYPGMHAPR